MSHNLDARLEKLHQLCPRQMKAFQCLNEAVTEEGTLSAKTKSLIAIGISAAIRCEPCLRRHVRSAMDLGSTSDEILEACGVAIHMGGGPTLAYCALYALDELESILKSRQEISDKGIS